MSKVILVTGSSRGLGATIVKTLVEQAQKVIINYCHSERDGTRFSGGIGF
jgi:3-oxoacyl-[acyl-carrier protein] reductase